MTHIKRVNIIRLAFGVWRSAFGARHAASLSWFIIIGNGVHWIVSQSDASYKRDADLAERRTPNAKRQTPNAERTLGLSNGNRLNRIGAHMAAAQHH
jgi:hypothetical protein